MGTQFFKWDETYSVNSAVLNDQHKELFNITNDLYEAFSKNVHREQLGSILNRLYDYAKYHFSEEEKLLKAKGVRISPDHVMKHREFENNIKAYKEKFESGRFTVTYEMMNFLRSWLMEHIKGTDKEYANTFSPGEK